MGPSLKIYNNIYVRYMHKTEGLEETRVCLNDVMLEIALTDFT